MPHRITKVVTRGGDGGQTGLADGSRVAKSAPRIQALGEVDELNSQLGLLLCEPVPDDAHALLLHIQNDLFDLGGELAWPGHPLLTEDQITALEAAVERYNARLPPLREFVLPGGARVAAGAHVCRALCRRAERALCALGEQEPITDVSRRYLNRLSDLLFVLARWFNHSAGVAEPTWRGPRRD